MKSFILVFFLLIISLSFIYAVPELPMIITGNVSINDKPADIGTEITARANNEEIIKFKINEKGKFNFVLQKLKDNQKINFYVDGISANKTLSYKSGDFKQLTLKIEKSYLSYYFIGITIILVIILIIWKRKLIQPKKWK